MPIPEIRILIVDDHPDHAASLGMVLEDLGHKLIFASSGEDALLRAREAPLTLVLLDAVMPGLDGFQTAERLRAMPESKSVPIIFLTGNTDGHDGAERAYSTGAVDYLRKPVEPLVLRSKVQVFVELFRKAHELARHEERHRIFAELTTDFTAVVRRNQGRFEVTETNEALPLATGYGREELATLEWRNAVAQEDHPVVEEALARIAAGSDASFRARLLARGGHTLHLEVFMHPVVDAVNGAPARVYLAAKDRTAEHRLEEELVQARKMDAIGRLAGGVAHDFNNMLTVISGNCAMLLEQELPEDHRVQLTEIFDAAERSAELTRQLLAFSRKQVMFPKVVELNAVVNGVMPMLERLIGDHVEVRMEPGEAIGTVRVDVAQLEQAIVNLILNSRDAMPNGGRITVRTAQETFDGSKNVDEVEAGRWAVLTIADTGTGMDEATRKRIFEPFFTTKARGRGTGLGLSTVHGFVRQSGGRIRVASKPGDGTTFRMYLPVTLGEPSRAPTVQPSTGPPPAHESVLLVDDEAAIRRITASMLENAGYTVAQADGGEAALALASDPARRFDLVLTDVEMPAMNGPEVYGAVRKLHPDIRVLYMSGYPEPSSVQRGVLDSSYAFIEKPFSAAQLRAAVRRLLDAKR